jgi:hypothetical protein
MKAKENFFFFIFCKCDEFNWLVVVEGCSEREKERENELGIKRL